MTLPPLPPRDLGSVRIGRVDQDMGYSDEAMRDYATAAVLAEREAIAQMFDEHGQKAPWDVGIILRGVAAMIRARTD